nr:MAG TPA: hypothetical protein [Caudoviricetes sp.]
MCLAVKNVICLSGPCSANQWESLPHFFHPFPWDNLNIP